MKQNLIHSFLFLLLIGLLASGCGSGTTANGGGASTPPIGPPPPPPPPPSPTTGNVTLSWTKPTQNTDGTPFNDLGGFRIEYGTQVNALNGVIDVADPNATSQKISNLSAGTYYFVIKSYTTGLVESDPSNPVSKTVP
jgi:hypothetical protein